MGIDAPAVEKARPRPVIVVSGRGLSRPVSGVERVALELLKAVDQQLTTSDEAWRVALPREPEWDLDLKNIEPVIIRGPDGHFWEQILPLRLSARLYVSLLNSAPLTTRKTLAMLHDASVFGRTTSHTQLYRALARMQQRATMRRAGTLVTCSEFSAREIQSVGQRAATVIHHGSDHLSHLAERAPIMEVQEPFVLVVGVARHKGLDLLESLAPQLAAHGLKAVVVGGISGRALAATHEQQHPSLTFVGRVADPELLWLYRRALCYAQLSSYEGFGLPGVEAQTEGCPVVAVRSQAAKEILGESAQLVAADPSALLSAILALMDPSTWERWSTRSRSNAVHFSWANAGAKLIEATRGHGSQ